MSREQKLENMLREITCYLASMPDAGLVAGDPRIKWYGDSKELRDRVWRLLDGSR